ncbi:aldehyde dehydrogenase family protein [candidate division KSB1 bacterium]|nr:MAG: aldehyde dehydrogenase family protein [candidate division KSB1 bacterium]MBC6949726.1 aldehyde dehydrogenase family protein [candidate division KSB1 bacterium]MCE7944514.1 aldehyde dehydrogenase family protein [Chlorobi bacterium CHB1]MDL1876331.1 aldehyde dehydrogenase family protein [Cytophagia bacterium CHB2]
MLHIPLLRAGRPYKSLETAPLKHFRDHEPVAVVSQANTGVIAKDLAQAESHRRRLQEIPIKELLNICSRAADFFMNAELPLDGVSQSPQDYVLQLSSTTGMPHVLCRNNMEKIRRVLAEMPEILHGLMHGLDLEILDSGWVVKNESLLSFFCQANALGAILPSNSPGVHSLWLPAIPLKVPLVLKPGREEPWTPYRVAQAFIAAGCPAEAFNYYPSAHSGATEILLRCNRSMFFGDQSSVRAWAKDPRVEIHGPGWSKIIIAEDQISRWEEYLEVMVTSIAANGGRSCLNASGIWVPSHGREIAEVLAQRLAAIEARAMDDPQAQISAFTNRKFAQRINDMIEQQLHVAGAEDLTAKYRGGKRLVEKDGCTFLLPTVVWCEDAEHPLANVEFLFPFASVVQAPQNELLSRIGTTLVLTAITENEAFTRALFSSPNVDRLNIGPIPTNKILWDQPHEGNLFEHLYRQRALQLMVKA